MPRPPLLPTIDWKAVFESGVSWDIWITQGEFPDHRERMAAAARELPLSTAQHAVLRALPKDVYVVAIAEDWCGDVVRHAPVLRKMEEATGKLHVRYITREQHPDVFARFLTNGGEAIPKFVFLSSEWVEVGNWGPMPNDYRRLIARGKACGDVKTAREWISKLYEADQHCALTAEELIDLVLIASAETV